MSRRGYKIRPRVIVIVIYRWNTPTYHAPAMPVDFLTEEQQRRHGRHGSEPTRSLLPPRSRYFHLDDAARELLAERRGDCNRLGLALQIVTCYLPRADMR